LILNNKPLVAIELDHGIQESQVRNALAKASLSAILGGFERVLVLFFIDPPESPAALPQQDNEERILRLYEQNFNTDLLIL
jgi:hypothetical protein